jgi:RimJ/RimL family protein N-acetyltransferase
MLRPATTADIAFIRGLTTRPDYAPFIGDSDDAQLQAWIDSASSRVLIWQSGTTQGFGVFTGVGKPGGIVELFRIALDQAGGGSGDAFFRALVDFAFRELAVERVWLDASAENHRAVKIYTRAGFRHEGTLRSHWFRPALGRSVDLVIIGMLRSEWESLEPVSARS